MAGGANVPANAKIVLGTGRTVGVGAEGLTAADGSQRISIADKPSGMAVRAVLSGEAAPLAANFLKFTIEQAAGEHYGIDSAGLCRAQFASGGSVSYYADADGVYEVHVFTNTMAPDDFTFFIPRALDVLVVVVGGGGGGVTGTAAGGGGAGVDASGDAAGTAGGCGVQHGTSGAFLWYGCGGPAGIGTNGVPVTGNMAAGIIGTYTSPVPYSGNGGAGGNAQGSAGSSGVVLVRFRCQ
jgi:hypothetical protein